MFSQDLPFIFTWWSVFFLLGAIFFPLTSKIFKSFSDHGYIFAKVIGILVLTYLTWILGVVKIAPFSQTTLFIILLVLIVINLAHLLLSLRGGVRSTTTRQSKVVFFIVLEEIIFASALFLWSWVKGHQPDLQGLEKFMDFGFINSLLRTKYFPPLDMWLSQSPTYSGHFINYYYFGHLVTAVLTKLTGINPAVAFNLMLATIFAFCFTGSFSIGINLISVAGDASRGAPSGGPVRHLANVGHTWGWRAAGPATLISGLLTGFLVTLAGNLHTIYAFFKPYVPADKPVPFWQLPFMPSLSQYWYPNATRFIPFTIHEFPSYSFVVSDLHGHVLDIPFVLLTIALLFSLTKDQVVSKIKLILLGFLLAIMYMTNAWDSIIYFGLTGLVFLYTFYKNRTSKNLFGIPEYLINTAYCAILLLVLFAVFSLPFQLHFKPFVFGIGIVKDHSPVWMLAVLWGFFYFCVAGFIVSLLSRHSGEPAKGGRLQNHSLLDSGRASLARMTKLLSSSDIFVLLMIILSTALLIFPELFYVKDIYPLHYRANTMFKLGYQAFIMLSLACGYIITLSLRGVKRRSNLFQELRLPRTENFAEINRFHRIHFMNCKIFSTRNDKIKKIPTTLYKILLLLLLLLVSIYPYFSVNSYFGNLKTYKGLYGLSYLEKLYPNDYQAIIWLQNNVQAQPVVLEAVGDSYTDYSRVSANTGLPTVLGWPVHEWLWRGSFNEAGKRVDEVKNFYSTNNVEQARNFIKKYNVKYVFVGQLEHQKYPELNEEKFAKIGKIIYQSGETRVYKITL